MLRSLLLGAPGAARLLATEACQRFGHTSKTVGCCSECSPAPTRSNMDPIVASWYRPRPVGTSGRHQRLIGWAELPREPVSKRVPLAVLGRVLFSRIDHVPIVTDP